MTTFLKSLRPCHALLTSRHVSAAPSVNKLAAIKELRESSGAPISDVKAALDEAKYDLAGAFQVLRKKGLAAANKKASRHAAEGLIGLYQEGNAASLVEINSETDFVARNDQFRSLVSVAAQAALRADASSAGPSSNHELDVGELGKQAVASGRSLEAEVQDTAGTVRENIKIRRAARLEAPKGVLASYLHISPAPGLGRIGSLVALEAEGHRIPNDMLGKVQEVGTKLAMHAAAAAPNYLDRKSVPEGALEAERDVLREQAKKSNKPANIIEKMIQGRLNKFYEEACFLEQSFIMDDALRVKDVVAALSKEAGVPVALTGFVRLQCGQGLEEEGKKDFASEVAETLERAA